MKKIRWGLKFLGICVVAFSAGIVAGFIKNGESYKETDSTDGIVENAHIVTVEEATLPYMRKVFLCYKVSSAGESIKLAEVYDDGTEQVIEVFEFNPTVLPISDIELLKNGINFEDRDEALIMIENFVS